MSEPLSSNVELIRQRWIECHDGTHTYRDPWQAVDDMGELLDEIERLRAALEAKQAEPFVYMCCEKHKGMPWSMIVTAMPWPPKTVCPICEPPQRYASGLPMPADETTAVTSMDYGGGPFDKDGNEGPNETAADVHIAGNLVHDGKKADCSKCNAETSDGIPLDKRAHQSDKICDCPGGAAQHIKGCPYCA
jgi:hypothetical protein